MIIPRRNTRSRHHRITMKSIFLVGLSFFSFHTLIFHRYIRIGISVIEQDGTIRPLFSSSDNHPNKYFCASMNASSIDGSIIGESVFHQWKYIDETIEREFPNSKVSGGIFLYPRQASILTHLIKCIHAGLGDRRKMITVCETGYGAGHSMALFQEASTFIGPVRVISFDKFDRPYQLRIWHHFNKTISASPIRQPQNDDDHNRKKLFDFVEGDSCKTVPNHLPSFQCDILHGSSLCPTDNIDLVENSRCGVLLTSTAMNSLNDRQVYFGPNAQWRRLRERNCISNITCFQEDGELSLLRDFIFAKEGSSQTGKFCVAVTTGRCQRDKLDSEIMSEKCTTDIDQLLIQLDLNKVCTQYQIETPL